MECMYIYYISCNGVSGIQNILANFTYFVEEFLCFYHVTYKSVENMESLSSMANIINIILPYEIVTFCKVYLHFMDVLKI